MKFLRTSCLRCPAVLLLLLLLLAGCDRARLKSKEYAYVSATQVNLRDRLAAVYNKLGVLKNGERVEVLEKSRRFARVRNEAGLEGWVEMRHLVEQDVYDGFQKLSADNQTTPVQAHGVTRADLNIHLTASRDADHLYQLNEGEKIELLKRAVAQKAPTGSAPLRQTSATPGKSDDPPKPVLEDWWLLRSATGRTGWVLARMVDIDAPLEIAQYAEGQRIVAFFVLNQVQDAEQNRQVPQYIVLLTEPKDGLPFDYNQARIFTWNTKRHRYETAYRERNLYGMFPVSVGRADFDKEGNLPTFTLPVKDENGNVFERKYKLNGPIVRRVLAPGEEQRPMMASKPASKTAAKASSSSRRGRRKR